MRGTLGSGVTGGRAHRRCALGRGPRPSRRLSRRRSRTEASRTGTGRRAAGPLTSADIARYRELFALQREGRWARGRCPDRRTRGPILLGHLLAERYLAKQAPRADYRRTRRLARGLCRSAAGAADLQAGARPQARGTPSRPAPVSRCPRAAATDLWDAGSPHGARATSRPPASGSPPRGRCAARNAERARAAFWAARANLRAHRPGLVVPLLRVAGDTADAFYGAAGAADARGRGGFRPGRGARGRPASPR